MKQIKLIRICSVFLSLILMMTCTATLAFAHGSENNTEISDNAHVITLDNGYKIVTTIKTVSNANSRSTIVTKSQKTRYVDSNNKELCSFIIFGQFNTATGQCVNSYYQAPNDGGAWRVEEINVWHDSYTVYGSWSFVKRVLGIKLDSISFNRQLSYS